MSKLKALRRPPVEVQDRHAIPKAVDRAVRRRDGNKCVQCGGTTGLQMEHRVPRAQGGKDTVENLRLLCDNPDCHPAKTKVDNKATAWAKRVGRADVGDKPKTRRPLKSPGFQKGLTKHFDNTVTKRKTKNGKGLKYPGSSR